MERKCSEGKETTVRKLKWDQLDMKDKLVYIEQAEYLISKGYVSGNQFDIARSIYEKRR